MCNVFISVCSLSSLSPPGSCCVVSCRVVSCLSEYPRHCLLVRRVFDRVKKRQQLSKVWNGK